jgi:GT2 family glycosyltransferase
VEEDCLLSNDYENSFPFISIVILNYNGWKDTIECLESVLKNVYENYKIIIVDNASTNESIEKICSWMDGTLKIKLDVHKKLKNLVYPLEKKPLKYIFCTENNIFNMEVKEEKIIFISAEKNNGFSAGNNIGIKFAIEQGYSDYIWLLNNDTVVAQDTLKNLHSTYIDLQNMDVKIGLLGSKLLYYHNPEIIQAVGGKFNKWTGLVKNIGMGKKKNELLNITSLEIDYPIGASIFVSNENLHKIGLMNESYFLYYEELDWNIRASKKGFVSRTSEKGCLYHKQGASTKTGSIVKSNNKNLKIERYKYQNLLKIYRLYFPKLIIIAYIRLMIIAIKKYIKGAYLEGNLVLKTIKDNIENRNQ